MKSTATAQWAGGLKDGRGELSTESRVLDGTPYSFGKRFEGEPGTNPEEMIAAAHAGCFTMALSMVLGEAGMTAKSLETKAVVTLDTEGGDISITHIALDLKAMIPGADASAFETAALAAKANCPISKLVKTEVSLTMSLDS